jgi:type II secretory pathway pseudopilin PulG
MTLVEVIVSIALLGIVAAMAMLVLTSSLLLSMRSADNTRQTSSAGTVMNQELIVVTSGSPTQAVVTFNGDGTKTATIDGSFVTTSSSGVLSDAEMKSFVPED